MATFNSTLINRIISTNPLTDIEGYTKMDETEFEMIIHKNGRFFLVDTDQELPNGKDVHCKEVKLVRENGKLTWK